MKTKTTRAACVSSIPPSPSSSSFSLLTKSNHTDVIILRRDRSRRKQTRGLKFLLVTSSFRVRRHRRYKLLARGLSGHRRVACSSITIDFAWEHYEQAEKAFFVGVLLPPTISKISILFQPTSFRPCLPF